VVVARKAVPPASAGGVAQLKNKTVRSRLSTNAAVLT